MNEIEMADYKIRLAESHAKLIFIAIIILTIAVVVAAFIYYQQSAELKALLETCDAQEICEFCWMRK